MRTVRLAGTLYLVLITAACDVKVGDDGQFSLAMGGRVSDEWKRSYSLPAGGRFEVVSTNGVIEAFAATGPQVEVVAKREIRAASNEAAAELLAKVQMVEDVTPDRVKIELKVDGSPARHQVNIQYRIGLPPGLIVSLKTDNGVLRLEKVQGRISATVTNGQIFGEGLSGTLDATTVNGGIHVDMTSVSGDSRMVTVNGPVMLGLSPDVKADVEAGAVNGGVVVENALALKTSERSEKRVIGQMNGGGPRIIVQATNGGVRVSGRDGMGRGFGRGRERDRRPAGG